MKCCKQSPSVTRADISVPQSWSKSGVMPAARPDLWKLMAMDPKMLWGTQQSIR